MALFFLPRVATDSSPSRKEAQPELDDLRAEALLSVLPCLLAGGFFLALLMAVGLLSDRETFKGLAVIACLWTTCCASYLGLRWSVRAAAGSLVLGLGGSMVAIIYLFPHTVFASGFSLLIIIAGLLLGPGYSLAAAFGCTVILSADALTSQAVPRDVLIGALFLIWASAFLAWLTSRPLFDAISWSLSAYEQAQRKTEEARQRQAELVKLSRSLNEAYCRLETLNDKLRAARAAAEQARQLKAEFASTVSHELRTPLNLIIGFSEMIVMSPYGRQESALTDLYRGDIEAIYRNACHLSNLIDDILDLAQVEAHRMALVRGFESLAEIAREAIAGVTTMYQERGLDIWLDIPADLPAVYVDRVRVRQVLLNLLANAARFTEEGGVTISARKQGEDVVVSVKDTGVGIPAADLPRVFEEFSRFDSSSVRKHSGLGLAICRRFVELHGGRIWVESGRAGADGEGARGTTFFFTLPTKEVPVEEPHFHRPLLPRLDSARPGQKKSVFVVDANQEVAKLFRRYLDGCDILALGTAEEAMRVARETLPGAVLARLPSDAAERRQLEALAAAFTDLPIITYRLSGPWDAGEALGVAGFLLKPVTSEQLRAGIERVQPRVGSVLVVDDDAEMVRLLDEMVRLAYPGCAVYQASDGLQALEVLEARRVDVALLDLSMPGLDGAGVLRVLQSSERWRELPVIVVTAHGPNDRAVGATELRISRRCGLQVGEMMHCLQAALNVLEEPAPNAEGRPEERWGALAWLGISPLPKTEPVRLPGERSTR